MISFDFANGLFVYLLVWVLTIVILWSRELWRNRAYRWDSRLPRLMTCLNCHYSFLSKENANVERCPRCNTMCIYRKH